MYKYASLSPLIPVGVPSVVKGSFHSRPETVGQPPPGLRDYTKKERVQEDMQTKQDAHAAT